MGLIQDLAREHINAIAVDPVGDKIMRMNNQTGPIGRREPSCCRAVRRGLTSFDASFAHSLEDATTIRSMPFPKRSTGRSSSAVGCSSAPSGGAVTETKAGAQANE